MSDKDQLDSAVVELQLLIPALSEALERDGGAPSGERVSGSSALGLPVNAAVLSALRLLDIHLRGAVIYAAEAVGESPPGGPLLQLLDHVGRLHERMLVLGDATGAKLLVVQICQLLGTVRRAVGLSTPDRRMGEWCPMHDSDLTELVAPGDFGTLCHDGIRDGVPVNPRVEWVRSDSVLCRQCGASWVPSQYALLRRMIDEAGERRNAAVA